MKLIKSNYDNKAVIEFLKNSFSVLESSESSFKTSEFTEVDISANFKEGEYTIELTQKGLTSGLAIGIGKTRKEKFTNKTDSIKCILIALKIIKK